MIIINLPLLLEFKTKGRCEWCKKSKPTDGHHLWARGLGGGGRLDVRINLISLCRYDHNEVHLGHITRSDLLAVVAVREGVMQDDIEAEINRLRRLPKGTPYP